MRECRLGGYTTRVLPFHARDHSEEGLNVLVFSATTDNSLYLGADTMENMANQIVVCKGGSGHNVEYISRLADFTRKYIPEDKDEHLFLLDGLVRNLLQERYICLDCLITQSIPSGDPNAGLVTRRKSVPNIDHIKCICDFEEEEMVQLPLVVAK